MSPVSAVTSLGTVASVQSLRILFATAELRPLVSVGGLGEAAAGLVDGLRRAGHTVDVVVPDYQGWSLASEEAVLVEVPAWAQPASARWGTHAEAGEVTLVDVPGIRRPDPYVDASGVGWDDNDRRFAAFSAAVASIADRTKPDVVQINDWHTSLLPVFMTSSTPVVLTIHNLAHQGWASVGWLHDFPAHRDRYRRGDAVNLLAGAISVADAVVAVSPTYADEILTPDCGMGLHELLASLGTRLHGIRNGIDTRAWDPSTDPLIPARYGPAGVARGARGLAAASSRSGRAGSHISVPSAPRTRAAPGDLAGKAAARAALCERAGWAEADAVRPEPIVAIVSRLVEQKGIDLALVAARFLGGMRARMAVLGSGERGLADWGRALATDHPERFWFTDGFDVPLSHLLFAGADLFLMPSRFEPCGLAQMQAMAYGTIPVVTPVGGLVDTVIDADAEPATGTGFVAASVDAAGVVDALHRALRAWRHAGRRRAIMGRGMAADWSWETPARQFADLYQDVIANR